MTGPAWLPRTFAALMLVVASYCAGRVAARRLLARRTDVDADGLHVLMGIAMAGMFAPGLNPVPDAIWPAMFAACAAWFGWRALGRSRGCDRSRSAGAAPHAVESVAMTYMFWFGVRHGRTAGAGSMPGMTASAGNLALTVVLAVFMIGYILWTADRLASPASASAASPRASGSAVSQPALAPRLAACYKITMSIAMSYMLITML